MGRADRPARATIACRRCAACRGLHQPAPATCPPIMRSARATASGLSDAGQPQLDFAASPEIIVVQHQANRLLRRYTPQELMLAYQAAARATPSWPPSPAAFRTIGGNGCSPCRPPTTLRHPTDHDAYRQAAIYRDVIALAAAALNLPDPSPVRHSRCATPGQALTPRKIFWHRTTRQLLPWRLPAQCFSLRVVF